MDEKIQEMIDMLPEGIGKLNEKMGIEFVSVSPEKVVATMPVAGNTQPYGILHGGASVVLAETLGSMGAGAFGYPDYAPVGIDINATHHKSAAKGVVTGVATAIHLGKTVCTYQVEITNESGDRVCTSRITCAMLPVSRLIG